MDQCKMRKKSKKIFKPGLSSKTQAAGCGFGCANGNGSGE